MHDRAARMLLVTGMLALALTARANGRLAPIPSQDAVSSHGPFEMGACETCHQRHDPKSPGPAVKGSAELCLDCHEEFNGKAPVKMDKALHPTAKACTTCHNPHNSKKKKLRM